MTIDKIKDSIYNNVGENVKVIYNGGRNKKEEYFGKISETYNSIFIIEINEREKKSFSYRDILVNVVEVFFV